MTDLTCVGIAFGSLLTFPPHVHPRHPRRRPSRHQPLPLPRHHHLAPRAGRGDAPCREAVGQGAEEGESGTGQIEMEQSMTARILDISPDEYHALPNFSSSVAKVLIAQSPLHAKAAIGKKPSKIMDRGTVIHRLVLGKGKDYEVIQHGDWKTNAAKAKRDDARARGFVPVLAHEFEDYSLAAESIRVQLAERNIILDGESELAIEWTEHTEFGDVLCKGMLDHAWLDIGTIIDLKVTENAAPSAVERTSENLGYAIQAAAYPRALAALRPGLTGRVGFAFAFCEPDAPHAINLSEPDGNFQELGTRRWLRAVKTWAECTKTGNWPSYGTAVNPISAPSWALSREGFATDER